MRQNFGRQVHWTQNGLKIALGLAVLATPASADDCRRAERAEQARARCVVTLIRAGMDAARAEAECAAAYPVRRCDD